MGEEINTCRIECYHDTYQIDFRFEESHRSERCFIRKDALLAMLCVAEKDAITKGEYPRAGEVSV
jgi:hypothetical protein